MPPSPVPPEPDVGPLLAVLAPPAPPSPLPPVPLLLELVDIAGSSHSPVLLSQTCPGGQITPSQGQSPQAPVTGSQQPPPAQGPAHWFWMHVGVPLARSQY